MKKIAGYILGGVLIALSLFFLFNIQTDIQLGFGAILLAMGLNRFF